MVNELQILEHELAQTRTELHAENQRGALKDSNKVAELEAKLLDLSQRLEVEQRLAENKQEHELRVEESQHEIAYIMDTLRAEGLSMRELTINEEAYQILRQVVQMTIMELDEKRLKEVAQLKDHNSVLTASKDSLQKQYDRLYENYAEVKSKLSATEIELEDAELKRDAAADQLEDAKKEITRLNSYNDELRDEIAAGAKETVKVTNSTGNLAELVQQFNASKPAIYDIKPLDNRQSRFQAKIAETDELIEFGYLEKGKYREVTAEEAEVFRTEYETKRAEESVQVDAGEGMELTTQVFQESDSSTDRLDEGNVSLEVAGQGTTLEARVAELERAVFGEVRGAA